MKQISEKLYNLCDFLYKNSFQKEAEFIKKLSEESQLYTIKPGDTLGQIAEDYDVSTEYIMDKNDISQPHKIYVGKTIKIPYPAGEDEIVAATLMGEGGSEFGVPIMRRVLAVINNRAKNTGKSKISVVLHPYAFSYWNGKSVSEGTSEWSGSLWESAKKIVKENDADNSVGNSTYYYNPNRVNKIPSFARDTNRCWTELHKDEEQHVYGLAGKPWDSCRP